MRKNFQSITCAATLLSALAAQPSLAQTKEGVAPPMQAKAEARVTDPSAAVPAVAYRSVFKETSVGVEMETVDWRKANDDVGKFTRGHVDILKAEDKGEDKADAKKDVPDKAMMQDQPAMKEPMKPSTPAPDAAKPTVPPAHKH